MSKSGIVETFRNFISRRRVEILSRNFKNLLGFVLPVWRFGVTVTSKGSPYATGSLSSLSYHISL